MKKYCFLCYSFVLLVGILGFTSCSPSLKVSISDTGDLSYNFETSVSPVIEETVRSFTGLDKSMGLFNGAEIEKSLKNAGLAEIVVKTPTATSLSVSATVDFDQATPLHNLKELDLLPQVSGALSLGESAGTKELRLTVSPEIMQKILTLIPSETAEYAELLSAPVFTEEQLSASEYVDLIAAVYGSTAANQLQEANISVQVTAPSEIRGASISNGEGAVQYRGKTAEFSLPLSELFTYLDKIVFCVQY